MIIIFLFIVLLLICVIIGHINNADIIISPIKGMMFGVLYHKELYIDEDEHTIQLLVFIFSINIIWINRLNG